MKIGDIERVGEREIPMPRFTPPPIERPILRLRLPTLSGSRVSQNTLKELGTKAFEDSPRAPR
jgi:hypothetical protein